LRPKVKDEAAAGQAVLPFAGAAQKRRRGGSRPLFMTALETDPWRAGLPRAERLPVVAGCLLFPKAPSRFAGKDAVCANSAPSG